MSFVAGEKKPLRLNTQQNLSGNTGITLTVQRPNGSGFTVANPAVMLGTINATDEDGNLLLANEYVVYTTTASDFPVKGRYKLQLKVAAADGSELLSLITSLDVEGALPAFV